jgi:hypothetical protein
MLSAWTARPLAASSTWLDAAPVSVAAWLTPETLSVTSAVPAEASWALRAICGRYGGSFPFGDVSAGLTRVKSFVG